MILRITLGLAILAAPAVVSAQEADGPVKKKIDQFQNDVVKKFPADRLKAYEEGVAQVKGLGTVEKALKVGDKAPDFELPDGSGNKVKLSKMLETGPVVVTWYRGGWCPYCNIALMGFQEALPEIKAQGASLVAISPETPDNTMKTSEMDKLGFEVLSDKANKVAHAYGVAYKMPPAISGMMKDRLAKQNGDDSNELPLGATYVIDRSGVIRYAFVDHDYRKRAEPSAVVAALKALKKP